MDVRIKRIDQSLPLPVYETGGSVGFDFLTREEVAIEPGSIAQIPANVIMEVPKGYALIIASRSSTPKRHGLVKPHGIGVIDQDYCGEEDEIKIQVMNTTAQTVVIPRGAKIAQGIFMKVDQARFIEVETMNRKTRGGFGSTDSAS